jgi:ubiquinone/menaquinone biosynthesis C-methylase UbiE
MIELARRTIAERALANVTLVHGDAAVSGLEPDSFDLAHERLVLVNHRAPRDVVNEMVRVVRPGGWVAVENVDWIVWTCEPPTPLGTGSATPCATCGAPPASTCSSAGGCPPCCAAPD